VGVVRRMDVNAGRATLHLTTRKGRFNAVVGGFNNQAAPRDLIDSLVSVEGACTSDLNGRGQLSGVTLNVPSLAQVSILEAPPADPFTTQTVAINTISVFNPDRLSGRRIKLGGVVTLLQRGEGFWMQDGTGGIRIHTQQEGAVRPGDQVEVLGFPAVGEFVPCLEESIWRRTGTGPSPKAERTTAQEILLRGTNDASVVELEAQLLQSVAGSARPRLVLQDGPITFTAQLQTGADGRALGRLEPGSRVRLRGACAIQGSEDHEPVAFRLIVADPKDVAVVKTPPCWTARNTLKVAAGLGLAVVLALAWIVALRKRVRMQTEEIRQKLKERNEFAESLAREKTLLATLIDHLPDMVFVKDPQARYVLTNQAHSRFHGVPSSERFLGKSAADLLPNELARIYAQTDWQILNEGLPICEGEEPARNGEGAQRWLSTTKVPLRDAQGKIIGLVGISRDITERKKAEAKLEQTHKALVIASREAGMAEVATSVLHNVGNVLNSVNVSANLVSDRVRGRAEDKLERVANLMQEHEADLATFITQDSRGRHLPAFIAQLAKHLEEERRLILDELHSLRQNIEHIKDIVAMQQGYAKAVGLQETVKPQELMEDALRMSTGGLARHGIHVERAYDSTVPEIQVEKHKVVQILVNLVRNAKHACDDSVSPGKRITVRVANEVGRIQFSVTDNGIGIPSENLTRIFNHGFTTRKHGHGFGLHSGALAAQEVGGRSPSVVRVQGEVPVSHWNCRASEERRRSDRLLSVAAENVVLVIDLFARIFD
jgi:PAS domain S-box-containing protein